MRRDPWELLPLFALLIAGLALRVSLLHHGYQPDELANLDEGSLWTIVWDAESAVNPPLLRAVYNGLFDIDVVLDRGRQVNVLLGTACVALGWAIGRRVGGTTVTALLGGALLATNPALVEMSACCRSYPAWCLVACWHVLAVTRWLSEEGEARTRWLRQMTASAVLLPWLHYVSVPLLLLVGGVWLFVPGRREGFGAYVPAGLGILPMAWLIASETSTRVPTRTGLDVVLKPILALGQNINPVVGTLLRSQDPAGPPPDLQGPLAVSILAFLAAHLLLWPRLDLTRRWLVWGAISLLITVVLLSQVQLVRSPVAICLLVFMTPLVTGAVGALRPGLMQTAGALFAAWWLIGGTTERLTDASGAAKADALRDLSADWRSFDAARRGRPIMMAPTYTFVGMNYYLNRNHLRGRVERCEPWSCFTYDGVTFLQAPEHEPRTPPDGLLFTVGPPPKGLAEGCALVAERPQSAVYDCTAAAP
jgi:hypothetical protein